MKKVFLLTHLFLFLLTASALANITLTVEPMSQSVILGNQVDVAINISGLGNLSVPALGAYDLGVTYDPAILSFNTVTFGNQLDLMGLGSITGVDHSLGGTVDIYEVSLDFASDLNTLQVESFNLFTMTFDTLAIGISDIDFSQMILSDAVGNALTAQTGGGMIKVQPIPVPGAFMLGSLGLSLVSYLRRRRFLSDILRSVE